MIDFSEALSYCKSNPIKLDYTPYPKYGVVRIKSPMRKWKVLYDKDDNIVKISYIYREYKEGTKENDYGYKTHYMAPKTNILDVLEYINRNDYHIPRFKLEDEYSIKEYAASFDFDAQFEGDDTVILYSDVATWKIEYNPKEEEKVKAVYRLNYRFDYQTRSGEEYWGLHKGAPLRNIAASIYYCYNKNKAIMKKRELNLRKQA